MVWKNCTVSFNSDSTGALYCGDIVTGSVILILKQKHLVKDIEFRILGFSKAKWTRPMPTIPYIKIYSQKTKVLDIRVSTFQEMSGKTIGPGVHVHYFHFALPHDLPSSFESSIAKVFYFAELNGYIDNRCKKTKQVPLKILSNLNLNGLSEFQTPKTLLIQKSILCISGNVYVNVKTYQGFASHQIVPFEVKITNENNTKISKFRVTLIQKLKYVVSSGYAEEEISICKVDNNTISKFTTEEFSLELNVPPLPPTSTKVSNPMVEISYIFRVELMFSYHLTAYGEMPVTIATVPVIFDDFDF